MTVVFDAEPLLAFAFDEPGAGVVEDWLDRVYDGTCAGYVTTVNLAEFRYVAARSTTEAEADGYVQDLLDLGVTPYGIDDRWVAASTLKARYALALGDAYAVAAARELDDETDTGTTLLVGADDDYDAVEDEEGFDHLVERIREEPG